MVNLSSISSQLAALQKVAELRRTRGDMGGAAGDPFATMLRGIMTGGPSKLSGIEAQLMLGGQFLGAMSGADAGREAGELAGLGDAALFMDSLSEFAPKGGAGGLAGLGGGTLASGLPGGAGALATVLEAMNGGRDAALASGGALSGRGIAGTGRVLKPSGAHAAVISPKAEEPTVIASPAQSPGQTMASAAGHVGKTSPVHDAGHAEMVRRAYGSGEAAKLAGLLAARFESGGDPGAVGHDRVGGTSYGMYQIASRTGTFGEFLTFLDRREPGFAAELRAAGNPDTGSRSGGVPDAWRGIAAREPDRFADLQHEFIRTTHFMPAARKVAQMTGLDFAGEGGVLAQVLWSTAVQHGASGSARIFARAVDSARESAPDDFGRALIKEVYRERGGQFGSSTRQVQAAVHNRFDSEMELALAMFDDSGSADFMA
ncbi:hypothetical protein GGQ74_002150 [Desulfobaculum xiamenense]|uniref:Type VI secretion system spike protein VgrG3-like C-terminal domain-containing protein n=1 Tax=Desulfobaculum xiamenense TaxID=995050 RepID=A0A846QMR6_9BACT|nr:hypothetical protein [Desulfobaculum xiamenense]NJB68477.1 hypothetical protein [Desulfobaculum xiamenense]